VAATPTRDVASRVAETPAANARAIVGTAGTGVDEKRFRETTSRKTSPPNVSKNVSAKRRAGSNKPKPKPGLASFGAMVREGRELAETERGGGAKRARR
jgi:hypothetical protein